MIKCNDWPVAVCTWSLRNDFDRITALADQTGLKHLHLALSPALAETGKKYLVTIHKRLWKITATMIDFPQEDYSTLESIRITGGIVPDQYWDTNKERVFDAIDLTARLAVRSLSLHLGFLDLEDTDQAKKLCDRVKVLADKALKKNIQLLMETGQETADQLRQFLEQLSHPALAVNFDPANMILYDKGDPAQALHTLAPWIKHVHIKDAIRTSTPGIWGGEVPWPTGQVNAAQFLNALKQINFTGPLAIERESGDNRFDDIKSAIDALKSFSH
jgi:L-ribulose-5-phosphate 3-epimerase